MLQQAPTCPDECAPRDLPAAPPAPCTRQHLTWGWSGPGMDCCPAVGQSPLHTFRGPAVGQSPAQTQASKYPFGPPGTARGCQGQG